MASAAALLLLSSSGLVPPTLKTSNAPLPRLTSEVPSQLAFSKLASRAGAAVVPLVTALPSWARTSTLDQNTGGGDGGGIVGLIINTFLALIVGAFGLYIANYAKDAAAEIASQTGERAERLGLTGEKAPAAPQSNEPLYDDTDMFYKDNQKAVENSRTREKKSKQVTDDGKRFAPWMVIDEKKVEQIKKVKDAERKAKKAGGKPQEQGGFKNPFA